MQLSRILPFTLATAMLMMPLAAQQTTETTSSSAELNFDNASGGSTADKKVKRFWVGVFDSAGLAQVCIKLEDIVSVSIQSYALDGSLAITECTVDTKGNNSIRIYGTRSAMVKKTRDRLSNTRDLIDSKTDNASRYPSKKFPEGAYSHNVEFQVESDTEVKKVYQSILNAWVKNEGCVFRP